MVDPIKDGFDVAFGAGPLQDSTLIAQKCSAVHSSCAPHPTSPATGGTAYRSQAVEQPALHRLRLQRATQAHDPFELSFSTLISAFYEAACEIITEKSARV